MAGREWTARGASPRSWGVAAELERPAGYGLEKGQETLLNYVRTKNAAIRLMGAA